MAKILCPACHGIGTRYDELLPGWCRGCSGTGYRGQSWVEKAFDEGPRIITDGHGGLGPCINPGCYLMGCDNEARMGLVLHWDDLNPHFGKRLDLLRDIPYLLDDLDHLAFLHASHERPRAFFPELNDREFDSVVMDPARLSRDKQPIEGSVL